MQMITTNNPRLYLTVQEALQLIRSLAQAIHDAPGSTGDYSNFTVSCVTERDGDANQSPNALTIQVYADTVLGRRRKRGE